MRPRGSEWRRPSGSFRPQKVANCAAAATAACLAFAPGAHAHASRTSRSNTLHVATWNLRGVMDRWSERKPILLHCLAKHKEIDVIALQEVMTGGFGQDKLIRDSLQGQHRMFACRTILEHLDHRFSIIGGAYKFLVSKCIAACLCTKRSMSSLLLFVEGLREQLAFRPARTFQFLKQFMAGAFTHLGHLLMSPFFGNALICREDVNGRMHSILTLGDFRVAQKVTVSVPPSETTILPLDVLVVNVHLHHGEDLSDVKIRKSQMKRVLEWIGDWEQLDLAAVVLMGDFNAPPTEEIHEHLKEQGFCSSYAAVHGAEPEKTFPSGLQAPLMDMDGEASCLDYIYVASRPGVDFRVLDSSLLGDKSAKGDNTLFPSDHFGVRSLIQFS